MTTETTMSNEDLDALLADLGEPTPNVTLAVDSPTPEVSPEPVATVEVKAPSPEPEKLAAPEPVSEVMLTPTTELESTKEPAGAPIDGPERNYEVKGARVQSFIDSDQLKRDVQINSVDLDNAMMQHASLFVHYATQAVAARKQYDRVKNSFEILEAKLDAEHREKFIGEGKKVTEAQIKAAMTADKRWSQGQALVIDAHSAWKLADIAQSAFDQRKDLLLEVARDRRKEKEGQLRVFEAQNQRDRVTSLLQDKAA